MNYHYTDFARDLIAIKKMSGMSERDLAEMVGTSKSQVNRLLQLRKLPPSILEIAEDNDIELYVLYDLLRLEPHIRIRVENLIFIGKVRTRDDMRRVSRRIKSQVRSDKRRMYLGLRA